MCLPSAANPFYHSRLDCTIVHGKMATTSCEVNALKRFSLAFLDCLYIYGPVHLIPTLLFNGRSFIDSPLVAGAKVLGAIARSSAFLSTFIATIYYGYVASLLILDDATTDKLRKTESVLSALVFLRSSFLISQHPNSGTRVSAQESPQCSAVFRY